MSHAGVPAPSSEQELAPQRNASQVAVRGTGYAVDGWQVSALDPFGQPLIHRGSISTSDSASTSSNSPTTSHSLLDSHSVSETPSTSPDTPASVHSMGHQSIPMALRSGVLKQENGCDASGETQHRSVLGPKRARNLKNLAVDTASAGHLGRAIATASFPVQASAVRDNDLPPPTPGAFVRPPKNPARKNSALGLTIQTRPALDLTCCKEPGFVPPTPSLIRPATLRHFQSSPSLPTLTNAATTRPIKTLQLQSQSSRKFVPVGFSDPLAEQDENSEQQNFDIPLSREEKPQSYPDGPICIYDPHVYLYFEPTALQASTYDCIFNVASEVKNPFDVDASMRADKPLGNTQEPATLPPGADSEPRKPSTAIKVDSQSLDRPEYIHVPWEHNTDIVPDLYHLVKLIDEKVQESKSVLIHCQCGVSRSASLIVAYGLYKNPSMTVQEAYDAVKRRSKWISPNMNFIMQLQEFRTGLLRSEAGFTAHLNTSNPRSKISHRNGQRARTLTDSAASDKVPQSAPLQPDSNKLVPPPISVDKSSPISPGPSSAPSEYHWSPSPANGGGSEPTAPRPSMIAIHPQPAYVDESGNLHTETKVDTSSSPQLSSSPPTTQSPQGPVLTQSELRSASGSVPNVVNAVDPTIDSARSTEFSMSAAVPPALDDTFGLTSPRIVSFNPFEAVAQANAQNAPPPPSHAVPEPAPSIQSPRSEEFAMTSIQAAPADDAFGLTSPRATATFGERQLPFRKLSPHPEAESQRMSLIMPSEDDIASLHASQARAELKSKIGMSTRSNVNLRSAYDGGSSNGSGPHVQLPPFVLPAQPPPSAPSDLQDALLSPRAIEFTNNPFHEAAATDSHTATPSQANTEASVTAVRASDNDPRSPPQKGQDPVVRNIADVL